MGWLAPTVGALAGHRIDVLIPPCPFAAGTEEAVVRNLPTVRKVWGPAEAKKMLLWGWPEGEKPQVLAFLGGDQSLAALLARRLGIPALAYSEGKIRSKGFRYVCLPDETGRKEALRAGIDPAQLVVVGNLMADALANKVREREDLILFFLGSRPYQVRILAGYWLAVARGLVKIYPQLKLAMPLSPFVKRELLEEALANPRVPGAIAGRLISEGEKQFVRAGDLVIQLLDPWAWEGDLPLRFEYMLRARLALTIPGTNTMELAAAGTPTVVVAPTFDLKDQPLEGILGILGKIPAIGEYFIKKAMAKLTQGFVALPNRHGGELVVPELVGEILPSQVIAQAEDLLNNPELLGTMEVKLRSIAGPSGAAERFAQLILKVGTEKL